MNSKNKKRPTVAEAEHIQRIKEMPCGVCEAPGPSDCHELDQGVWFLSIPLCKDCHQGAFNGIHGQQRIWKVKKLTEQLVLAATVERLVKV